MISLLLLTAFATIPPDYEGPITYEEVYEQAVLNCKNSKSESIDLEIIDTLIEIEIRFGVPKALRGMTLAAACMESGFNPNAKGDRKFSKDKKTPKALGLFQQWKIYEKMYPGMDRADPRSSAATWMHHIVKQIPKIKKRCGYKTDERIWIAAWVTGIRYRKPGGRCKERPKHLRLLRKWHKQIKKNRKSVVGC